MLFFTNILWGLTGKIDVGKIQQVPIFERKKSLTRHRLERKKASRSPITEQRNFFSGIFLAGGIVVCVTKKFKRCLRM